jgi:hypothetical protein
MRKRWKTTVREGRLIEPKDGDYGLLIQSLEGKDVSLAIGAWKPYSSDRQFAYYYGVVLKLISEKTGYSREELDGIFKGMYLYEYIKLGDKMERRLLSKKEITTARFTEYMNDVIAWAAKPPLSLVFPNPEDVSLDEI